MATNWFDDAEVDRHDDHDDVATSSSLHEDTQGFPAVSDEDVESESAKPQPSSRKPRQRRSFEVRNHKSLLLVLAMLLVVVISVVGIIRSLGASGVGVSREVVSVSVTSLAAPVSSVQPTSTTPASSTSTSAVPVEKCPDQPEVSQESVEGVVVAFQAAYFAGDSSAIGETIAPGSYLAGVDWLTVVGDLVGADFCVKIASVSGDVVEADTTVKTVSGEELLFRQKITVIKTEGGYRIWEIEDRPLPDRT